MHHLIFVRYVGTKEKYYELFIYIYIYIFSIMKIMLVFFRDHWGPTPPLDFICKYINY